MKSYFQNINFSPAPLDFSKVVIFICVLILIFPTRIPAQTDTVYVPSDILPGEGNLNDSVAAHIGNLSNLVFELEPYGYYILTDSIVVPKEEHLTIVAPEAGNTQETAPPQIIWSSNTEGSRRYIIKVFGDLTLKNIWIMYAGTDGWQVGSSISFIRDSLNVDKQYGNFEGVIFDYSCTPQNASGAVCIETNKFIGTFKNCYWKNCIDSHLRYYGRAVSFPYNTTGYHIDSLIFENCTFANLGYVYSQEGNLLGEGQYSDNIHFNHCTFLNVVMFSLESGWWYKMSVTNSIFVNTHMYGNIPVMYSLMGEPYGGTLWIDSVANFRFTVSFTEQDRHILFAKSSYYIEEWLSDWMANNSYSQWLRLHSRLDEIPVPQPMLNPSTIQFFESDSFPFMNKSDLYDSTDPGFILPPSNTTAIKGFLYHKWFDGGDSAWAWKPENSFNRLWPLEEDLSYTNETLLTAGMGEFPLGDLYHWWHEEYSQWKLQEEAENSRISYWLNTGRDSIFTDVKENPDFVNGYELFQNYPNPFNPTTKIKYSIPQNGYLSLKVYNLLGQQVATLFEGYQQAGDYVVPFDGSKLSSGVYLYRLKTNNFVQTKKLIFLK